MKELAVSLVCVLSWFGGGTAYLMTIYEIFGERPARADLSSIGFWTLLVVITTLPFHLRTVRILTQLPGRNWQRVLRALGWALLIALGSSAILSALLGQGRVLDVLTSEGGLVIVWFSATAILFGIFGAAAHHLELWIEPPQNHVRN